jgi:hypothetical protein
MEGFIMSRFYIELQHDSEPLACARAVQTLLRTGSHFLTNADFGCFDGDHSARIVVDVDSKEEARTLLPPEYRYHAKIVQLNKFKLEEIDEMIRRHPGAKKSVKLKNQVHHRKSRNISD